MHKPKHIHFVGIKGVGMTPLAIIAEEAGITVTGSDVSDTFITDDTLKRAGIVPLAGFSKEHVARGIDLVIATGAHGGADNIEVQEARTLAIQVLMKGEAVGAYMEGSMLGRSFKGISVAGSHGKTTTSALIATLLDTAGLSPSFLVGTSDIMPLGASGRLGTGEYFVAEADEYATDPVHNHTPQFLWQRPQIAVFTNIEHDHPDIYPDTLAVAKAFEQFAGNIAANGCLVACGDDTRIADVLKTYTGRKITYGKNPENDYVLQDVLAKDGKTYFHVFHSGEDMGEFVMSVMGEHNSLNGLAAMIVGLETGLSLEEIRKGLLRFQGAKRRLEYIGKLTSGALIYDDYAHHPTEIQKTLKALRQSFPDKKITCIFQPHTYSRTKTLLDGFSKSFQDADSVWLLPIYASLREEADSTVSSDMLSEKIPADKHARVFTSQDEVVSAIKEKQDTNDSLFVTMGAGDIYKINTLLTFAS